MPNRDGTGPWGQGPLTGRGAGNCRGNPNQPVQGQFRNPGPGGRGRGRGGHGYRHQFYATGLTGRQRAAQFEQPNEPAEASAQTEMQSKGQVSIDPELCMACGACVKFCPENAITLVDEKAVINAEKCVNDGACVEVCPTDAIRIVKPTDNG